MIEFRNNCSADAKFRSREAPQFWQHEFQHRCHAGRCDANRILYLLICNSLFGLLTKWLLGWWADSKSWFPDLTRRNRPESLRGAVGNTSPTFELTLNPGCQQSLIVF